MFKNVSKSELIADDEVGAVVVVVDVVAVTSILSSFSEPYVDACRYDLLRGGWVVGRDFDEDLRRFRGLFG